MYNRSGNSEKFALSVQFEGSLELPNGLILSGFSTTVRCPFIILLSKKKNSGPAFPLLQLITTTHCVVKNTHYDVSYNLLSLLPPQAQYLF